MLFGASIVDRVSCGLLSSDADLLFELIQEIGVVALHGIDEAGEQDIVVCC